MEEKKSSVETVEIGEKDKDPEKKEEKDDDDDMECAICATDIVDQFSRPEPCYHRFHYLCIKKWAEIKLTCPMCRVCFKRIFTYNLEDKAHPKLSSTEVFEEPARDALGMLEPFHTPYEDTVCRICGGGDNEEQILLCDDCDEGYHMYCLTPALTEIPMRNWYCPSCITRNRTRRPTNHAVATRTADTSRIANFVQQQLGIAAVDSESSEDEADDFSEMDRAVLDDSEAPGPSTGVRVERRRKKKDGKAKTKKRRSSKKKSRRTRARARNVKDEKWRNGFLVVPASHGVYSPQSLSITGGNDPYFEEEPFVPVTPTVVSPVANPTDKNDLVGQILTEQEKILANGKLFKIENGKFEPTKDFEKYQEKLHKKMDKETKKRLGMPVEEDETRPAWDKPTSSRQKMEDIEIDPEVQEQIEILELQDKEKAEQQLLDAQKKALADQKREQLEKKLAEDREAQLAARERKKLQIDAEESLKHQEKVRKERERRDKKDQERKEREDRKKKEKEREREANRAKEEERKAEEERRKKEKRRSRSPRKEKKDDRHRHREDRKRDERKNDRERKDKDRKDDRNDRDRRETVKPMSLAAASVASSSNGVLAALPPQAPPDYGSLYGNPFQLSNVSLLSLPEQQALLLQAAATQQLAFGGIPLPVSLPLPTGAGFPIPNQLAPLQPIAQAQPEERSEKNEPKDSHKSHKDQATKIIESYSIRTVRDYYTDKKISRQQYSDILKTLVGEYRRSKSVEQLKTKDMKKEIQKRTDALLKKAMKKGKEQK